MSSLVTALYPLWHSVRALCVVAVALAALTIVAFTPSTPSVIHDGLYAASIAPRLSNSDLDIYADAFAAVDAEAFESVPDILASAHNDLLKGHVLAAAYLSAGYTSTPEELHAWLATYGDHPQAARIASLAARKGVAVRTTEYQHKTLKGRGYADHLGRSTPPRAWYQGLQAWKARQYGVAQTHFLRVAEDEDARDWHRSAAYYWSARTAKTLDHDNEAYDYLEAAAQFSDTLYGALAQNALGEHAYMRVEAPFVSRELHYSPAVMRARALASLGHEKMAEKELRQLAMMLDSEERPAVIRLAAEMGLANLQIRLKSLSGLDEDQQRMARYPMPPQVIKAAGNTDPALVLAIALHESAFYASAGSEAGATGIMQLLPSTAHAMLRQDAFKTELASQSMVGMLPRSISDPQLNVRLGAHYLNILQSQPRVGNSLIHVLAAYNAGPGTVSSWHNRAKNIRDPLLYIESIPFPETHNYVLQTLHHQSVYQQLMGNQATALNALNDGKFPTIASHP